MPLPLLNHRLASPSSLLLPLQINHALKESALEAYNREYGLDGKK